MTTHDIRFRVLIDNTGGGGELASEWGLSIWIGTPGADVLLDSGASGAFLRNAHRLDEPLESADAFVLSHGHHDHGGGIPEIMRAAPSARLFLHPAAMAPHFALRQSGQTDPIGLPARSLDALRSAPERAVWTHEPTEVAPGVWASGPVPRRHPLERAMPSFFLDKACTLRDEVVDDQAVGVETPGGLVALCGCAHSGLVNTIRYVRETAAGHAAADADRPRVRLAADGLPSVRALLGGFHLASAEPDRLQATVEYLRTLDLEICAPCHCTGAEAAVLLRARLPQAFADMTTGSELRLAYAD